MAAPTAAGPRGALIAALGLAMVLVGAACRRTDVPPRNPLDDRGPVPTVRPGVTSYPPPFLPPSVTPTLGAPVASPGAPSGLDRGDAEAATGVAIEVLAQRMAVSATRLSRVSVEPVDWPDACLGVSLPGVACAGLVTPGYRVVLRYDTGSTHEVHTGRGGLAAWLPQRTLDATVREDERGGGLLALTDAAGKAVSVLLSPGAQRVDIPVGALHAADRVTLGVDDPRDGGPLRAVWIARR